MTRLRPARLAILVCVAGILTAGCSAGGDTSTTPPSLPSASPSALPAAVAPETPDEAGIHSSVIVELPATTTSDADAPGATPGREPALADSILGAHVPPQSIDDVDKRLNVTIGGKTVYIRNGGRVELGDDLAVEIYLDPYPPTTLHAVMDLYLTRAGEPVTDASIDVEFDMLSMAHGPFVATARKIGGGHHLATLDYIMFGAWDQFVTIREGLARTRFPVVIVAYP